MSDILGNKGIVEFSIDGGEEYTPFAGVLVIKPSKPSRAKVPNTAIDATKKTTLPGLPDYGSVEFEIKYKPATTDLIQGWFDSGAEMLFRVTLNDQITPSTGTKSTAVYTGYVESFDPTGEIKIDELVKNTVTIAVNDYEFTPAT